MTGDADGRDVADVAADVFGRGEVRAVVLLGLEYHDVTLGEEEEDKGHNGTEGDGETHGEYLHLGAKVNWDEGDPNDEGSVHGEADEFSLVEVLRHVSRLNRVDGAHYDEEKVEAERSRDAVSGRVAN